MSAIKCQAKNPATCRYHKPDASLVAFNDLNKIRREYQSVMAKAVVDTHLDGENVYEEELFELRSRLQEAEETWDATPDGLAAIDRAIDKATDPGIKSRLEHRKMIATWRLADAEEKTSHDEKYGGALIPPGEPTWKPEEVLTRGSYLWPRYIGKKYNSGNTLVQIKSGVIKDIKEAQKGGFLPKHVDFEVRARSGHLSVTIFAPEELVHDEVNSNGWQSTLPDAMELEERVEKIVAQYNSIQHDEIEGRRNLTAFWENVRFASPREWELKKNKTNAKVSK